MERIEITATTRTVLGKKVKQLRRQGLMPAHLYGPGVLSLPLQVEISLLRKSLAEKGRSPLIALRLDGTKTPRMVLVRGLEKDPRTGKLLHVDFYQVKLTEKIKSEVPVVLEGEAPVSRSGQGVVLQDVNSLTVECLPGDLVSQITIDLSSLVERGQVIRVRELAAQKGMTFLDDPEQVVVRVVSPAMEEVPAAKVEEEKVEEAAPAEEGAEE